MKKIEEYLTESVNGKLDGIIKRINAGEAPVETYFRGTILKSTVKCKVLGIALNTVYGLMNIAVQTQSGARRMLCGVRPSCFNQSKTVWGPEYKLHILTYTGDVRKETDLTGFMTKLSTAMTAYYFSRGSDGQRDGNVTEKTFDTPDEQKTYENEGHVFLGYDRSHAKAVASYQD